MTKQFPDILTERLLLRSFIESDLERLFHGLSHPDVIRYYGVSYQSLEATKAQMDFFNDLIENGTGIWWAICSIDNQIFYGAGGLNNVNQDHRKGEIGFWLLPEFWGKGIMQEAIPLICNYAFEQLGLHRIEGFVESENQNCKKALERLGFQHEGTMRDCEYKNGRYISLEIYAKLKQEVNE